MGLASKRKGRWRLRCWQKLFMAIVGCPVAAGILLVLVALFRAVFVEQQSQSILHILSNQVVEKIDESQIMQRAERLAGALKIPSVSYGIDNQEKDALLQLHQYLQTNFPLIHSSSFIKKEAINTYSLLYTVEGTTKGKLPYLLASHLDVVPVDPSLWDVPPFGGKIINKTFIYGRGAIDDKSGVLGIMEAVEYMIQLGHRPQRSFFMAFGHDEEISGKRGAQEIAKALLARGVDRLDFVLDEGFPLSKDLIPGTDKHVAMETFKSKIAVDIIRFAVNSPFSHVIYNGTKYDFVRTEFTAGKSMLETMQTDVKLDFVQGWAYCNTICKENPHKPLNTKMFGIQRFQPCKPRIDDMVGVSEKGSATLELSVSGNPGHSSFPPPESAIGILAAAVARLEENPQPSHLGQGPESATFKYLAPHVSFFYRVLYNNLWLFSGLMAREMERVPLTNAFVRTTTAITVFHGGIKDNVVPPSAKAVINHRVHPSQTVAEVIAYDRKIIADSRVHIRVKTSREAHPISPFGPDCVPFQMVAISIKQVFPHAIVVPAVFIANTDTRWYLSFTTNLYRFLPTVVGPQDVGRYHGNNERISVQHYQQSFSFYYRIVRNADILIDQVPASTVNNGEEEL